MAKIIKVENNTQYYLNKVDASMVNEDIEQALKAANYAVKYARTDKELTDALIAFSQVLACCFKYEYAANCLMKVLAINPKNKEAKMQLMFNLASLGEKDNANYYYQQVKDFVQTRKVQNIKEVKSALEEFDIDEENIQAIIKPLDIDFEKILAGERDAGHFTMHGNLERFNENLDKAVELVKSGQYEDALAPIERALKLNVRKQKKALAYYSQAVCYYNLKRYNDSKNSALLGFENDEDNTDLKLIYCEAIAAIGDQKELDEKMSCWFNKFNKSEYQYLRRITQIYMKSEKWEKAIKYLNDAKKYYKESYQLNEYLGICYFNLGQSEKAKSIFIKMNDVYGDLCNAKHYLYYLSTGKADGIPHDAVFGDWPELNKLYLNYLYEIVILDPKKFARKIVKDADKIVSIVEWSSQGIRSPLLFETIDRIMGTFSETQKLNKDLIQLKRRILNTICTCSFYDDGVKAQILFTILKYGVFEKFNVCMNSRLFQIKSSLIEVENNYALTEACYLACSMALFSGEEAYYKTEEIAILIANLAIRGQISWRSVGAIATLILEISIGGTPIDFGGKLKCNYELKRKYEKQLNSILSEEKLN